MGRSYQSVIKVIRIRDAFFKTHLYSDSTAEDDLELLRSKYSQWKQKA